MNIVHGQLQNQYISVYNDRIYIFDRFCTIYREVEQDFPVYAFKPKPFTQQYTHKFAHVYQPAFVQGRHFVKCFDVVYQVVADDLLFVCKIPNAVSTANHNKLFVLDDKLFACNGRGDVFLVDLQDKNKFYLQKYIRGNNFVCWCDRTVRLIPTQRVITVLYKNREYNLKMVHSDIQLFSFCLGGIACYQNFSGTHFVLVDLINFVLKESENIAFSCDKIQESLRLTTSGLVVKDDIIEKVMGFEFIVNYKRYYKEYLKKQRQHPDFPKENIQLYKQKLLQEEKIFNEQYKFSEIIEENPSKWIHLYRLHDMNDYFKFKERQQYMIV